MSIRALARRHGVHRRTVRQALVDATPPARKVPDRLAPVTGQHVDLVRRWLLEDLEMPRKQRHTARRVWQRLVEEQGAQVGGVDDQEPGGPAAGGDRRQSVPGDGAADSSAGVRGGLCDAVHMLEQIGPYSADLPSARSGCPAGNATTGG
jgi:hypothetical protein